MRQVPGRARQQRDSGSVTRGGRLWSQLWLSPPCPLHPGPGQAEPHAEPRRVHGVGDNAQRPQPCRPAVSHLGGALSAAGHHRPEAPTGECPPAPSRCSGRGPAWVTCPVCSAPQKGWDTSPALHHQGWAIPDLCPKFGVSWMLQLMHKSEGSRGRGAGCMGGCPAPPGPLQPGVSLAEPGFGELLQSPSSSWFTCVRSRVGCIYPSGRWRGLSRLREVHVSLIGN